LTDLSKDPQLKHFSGEIQYQTTFKMQQKQNIQIDAGTVNDIAELYINGKLVGVKWWGRRIFDVSSDYIGVGENQLTIKITTTLFNYCLSRQDDPVIRYWTARGSQTKPMKFGLTEPVRILK
jgi:hypothetical protein